MLIVVAKGREDVGAESSSATIPASLSLARTDSLRGMN